MEEAPSHYFSAQPDVASRPQTIALTLPDFNVELQTDSGMFSPGHVDTGTRLLLLEAAAPPPQVRTAVDVGCGYGPVAITMAHRRPEAQIWAIDTNERARALCQHNATALGYDNIRVVAPDQVPDNVRFDYLASNPPIRIGKAALHALLTEWMGRLAPGAFGDLVVQRHLGSDSLQRWLETERNWPTQRLVSRQGFRVLRTTIPATTGA